LTLTKAVMSEPTYPLSSDVAGREVVMCPFCIGTAVWIAAGVVSTGGVSALAVTKLWSKKAREREQGEGGSNDQ